MGLSGLLLKIWLWDLSVSTVSSNNLTMHLVIIFLVVDFTLGLVFFFFFTSFHPGIFDMNSSVYWWAIVSFQWLQISAMCAECSKAKFEVWVQSFPKIPMVCPLTWEMALTDAGETQLRIPRIVVLSASALILSSSRCFLSWAWKHHQNNAKGTDMWGSKSKGKRRNIHHLHECQNSGLWIM